MRNTRQDDIDKLEEAGVSYKHIDRIYRQTKNEGLERARKQLIEAHKKRDTKNAERIENYIKQNRW